MSNQYQTKSTKKTLPKKNKGKAGNKKRPERHDAKKAPTASLQPDNSASPISLKRKSPAKNRLAEKTGILLHTKPDKDYALLDSGDGRKLERYGDLVIDRPEGQAIWQKSLKDDVWNSADAVFTGEKDEEGLGRWNFSKKPLSETFPMFWDGLAYWGRFTSFRHTGVFPEQAAHWRFMEACIKARTGSRPMRVLNLFGYTGLASLVAARAGAHVTHVDASRKAIGWAKENQQRAGLEEKPIRWICEDAVRFCQREARRGNRYDAIVLDPPAFGRGPKGEVWQLFEHLPHMIDLCKELISDDPAFVVLTAYTIRTSFLAIHELMQEVFGDCGGKLESGELVIATQSSSRCISTSMFSRWVIDDDMPGKISGDA